MNLSKLLIVKFILILTAGPALGIGLIPGLLKYDTPHTVLSPNDNTTLDCSSLANPTSILTDSGNVTLEFTAENLLRTKTNDRLTADISTWGRAESIFLPLRIAKRPTTFALSQISSNASAYYDNNDTVTELAWGSNTYAWAINHLIGTTKIGIASSLSSGQAPGNSEYPQQFIQGLQRVDSSQVQHG